MPLRTRIARGDNLADRSTHHRGTDLDWLGVRFRRTHAAAHIGIEREPARPHEHFAVAGLRHRALLQGEVIEARRALGPALEENLAVDARNHRHLLGSQRNVFHHALFIVARSSWPAFPNIDRGCSFYHKVQAALEEKHHEAEERSASRSDVGAYGGDVSIVRIGMGEPAGEPLSG
jgi:hypothetical protein